MKKRFSKRRNDFKKAQRSGTSTAAVRSAKNNVDEFNFMIWLIQFIKPRSTKSNLSTPYEMETCDSPALSAESESELQQDDDLENEHFSDENSGENFVVDKPIIKKITRKRNTSEVTGNLKWNRKKVDIDQAEVEFLSKIGQFVEESTKETEAPKDANELFGLNLAAELKTLSPRNQL